MTKIIASAQGTYHGIFLTDKGEILCWDQSEWGKTELPKKRYPEPYRALGILERVIGISAGYSHFVALTSSGEVYTWCDYSSNITSLPAKKAEPREDKVIKVACSLFNTFVLTQSGEILTL